MFEGVATVGRGPGCGGPAWSAFDLLGLAAGSPETLAESLAQAPPGAGSAAWLDAFTDPAAVAALSGGELLAVVAGWERLIGWAQARQCAAMAAFAVRRPAGAQRLADPAAPLPPGGDRGLPGAPVVSEFAADELALALSVSPRTAGARLGTALQLTQDLPRTLSALGDGRISMAGARVVAEGCDGLPGEVRDAVQDRLYAPVRGAPVDGRPPGEVRRIVTRAVLAADPAAAAVRHDAAVAERAVRLYPERDGMAGIWALLPAPAATAVHTALGLLADQAAVPGPGGAPDPRSRAARRADVLVDLVTAAATGQPWQPPTPAPPGSPGDPRGGGAGGCDGGAGRPRSGRSGGRSAGRAVTLVNVTVAATTLAGLDDQPAELAGYGPIPATLARRLAARDATWRRLLTDPAGIVTDTGRATYTPPAALADTVRARDQHCRFPGCARPANGCDLDHTIPYPNGPTTAANMAALCRRHHRLKHHAGWTVHRPRDHPDQLTWTTPAGHTHTTTPTPPLRT